MYLKIKVISIYVLRLLASDVFVALRSSKKEKVEKLKDDEYRVWVKVPAENNLANTRVIELVRDMFPGTSIRIVSGHHSPSKILSIN